MSSQSSERVTGDELGAWPRSYGNLQGLAARYAQAKLDGRAVVNRAIERPILLDWQRGLKGAVAPGTPPELLLALPALPALLAKARYLGVTADPRRRSGNGRVYGFGATADILGRLIPLWLVARDDRAGHLVFDRIVARAPLIAPREDGGILPDAPGARTRALGVVLARARLPPSRQEGGGTDGVGASASTAPTASGPALDTTADQGADGPTLGTGNGASGTSSSTQLALGGDECEEQYHDELQICRSLPNKTNAEKNVRSRCWDSVEARRYACEKGLRGDDLPPLITERKGAPAVPSEATPSLPPLILPSPFGGGSGLPALFPRVPNY
jgi:Large polyvalent protein-associated domain 3